MRLGLSSAALPEASLEELLAACQRRGLEALELGDAAGQAAVSRLEALDGAAIAERARAAGVSISGVRSEGDADEAAAARVASASGAPVLVAGGASGASRRERALRLGDLGVEAAVVVGGDVATDEVERILLSGGRLAWEADPGAGPLGAVAARLLRVAGESLAHIRILGGGPETAMQEGRGVGELMARLALAGYGGALILSPSSPRYRVAWETWLGRRGGWGCGGKSADPSLVSLAVAGAAVTGGR